MKLFLLILFVVLAIKVSAAMQPIDYEQHRATQKNTASTISLITQYDNGELLFFRIMSPPNNGVLSVDGENVTYTNGQYTLFDGAALASADITYTPSTDFTGSDSFTYQVQSTDNTNSYMNTVTLDVFDSFLPNARRIGNELSGDDDGSGFGSSVSLSADGGVVAIGANSHYDPREVGWGLDKGHVSIYEFKSDSWQKLGNKIIGEDLGDYSGNSISLSDDGKVLAVGAYKNDGNGNDSGHVRIYQFQSDKWEQLGSDIDGEAAGDYSGSSVSLSSDGKIVAIGAYKNDGNGNDSGHVRIYQFQSDKWEQLGSDIDGETAGDSAGSSVSLSANGKVVAFTSSGNDDNANNSGLISIYQLQTSKWVKLGSNIYGKEQYEGTGSSVSISANGAIVAIGTNTYRGTARIYKFETGNWIQLGGDINGFDVNDSFANTISLSDDGNTLAVGAKFSDSNGRNSGHVNIFKFEKNQWNQVGFDITGKAEGDYFGFSASLSGDGQVLAVGSIGSDDNGDRSGQVRVSTLTTNEPDTDMDGVINNLDADDDNDSILDIDDHWPEDRRYSKDSDEDGMPDAWEMKNGLDHKSDDAMSDNDFDGLIAIEEFLNETSPTLSDTDFDTLPDNWELNNNRNPLIKDYQLVVAASHACAIEDSGVVCWGSNRYNQLNVPDLDRPRQLSLSDKFSCAIDYNSATCWGYRLTFPIVNKIKLNNPSMISSGDRHSCAIDNDGVVCWGVNDFGQTDVPDLNNPYDISLGNSFSCALDDSGVVCWGRNEYGQTDVPNLIEPSQIYAGYTHVCAIDQKDVVCWGNNGSGQTEVPELVNPTRIIIGADTSCAIDKFKTICWGAISAGTETFLAIRNPIGISLFGSSLGSSIKGCGFDGYEPICWGTSTSTPYLLIDPDNDGYTNQHQEDIYPLDAGEWRDDDKDGIGNNSDTDDDNDNIIDELDAFPLNSSEWNDSDGDLVGDNSDAFPNDALENSDIDADGIGDNSDNCVYLSNTEQLDTDSDAIGNACDADDDNDGVFDTSDTFPLDGSEQADTDNDGLGDNYEITNGLDRKNPDFDADGLKDGAEIKLGTNPKLADSDDDGVIDGMDRFPLISIGSLLDTDKDGAPDKCDEACIALGMTEDRDGIAPYTLLEQPTPQFASLSPTAKIIVTSSAGENFFDVAKYISNATTDNPVSVVGETFLISGSSEIDGFMVQPGVKYDLTNLKGGIDKLYFSGPLAEYADSILLDSATGVMQVSRLTDVGEEIVQFIATASAADTLIFTDGALSSSDVKAAVSSQTPLTDLTLDTSIKALDDKTITGATVKHIVLNSEGGSVIGLGPSIKTLISGNSGIDQIYVPAGSVVDASNLKSGRDEITVEGNLADYDITLDLSGNIVLNREVDIDDVIHTESVTLANGGNVATNDLVIFADQQLDISTIKQQL